jgi:serine/threonine protein kinase
VVQVYDVFETDTTEYGRCVVLVHELGEESLKDYLDKSGALTRLELQRLAHHMANGIAALHEAKIIHRDIKPANILSFQSGWKIADLGAAAVINSHATNSSITSADYYAGTLAYATPEHAMALHEGRVPPPVHRNADTWAFGVVLHEAATGTHPFPSTAALIAGTPTIDPSLSPELADLVQACLSPPEFRPRDGAALLTLLEQPPTAAAVPAAVPTPAVAGADGALDTPAPVPADTVTAAVPVGAAADEAAQARHRRRSIRPPTSLRRSPGARGATCCLQHRSQRCSWSGPPSGRGRGTSALRTRRPSPRRRAPTTQGPNRRRHHRRSRRLLSPPQLMAPQTQTVSRTPTQAPTRRLPSVAL